MTGSSDDRFRQLRHDLSNPLSAILAETQLMLLRADTLDQEPPSENSTGVESLQQAAMLPQTTGAAHPYAAIMTAFGGYDSACGSRSTCP